MINNMMQRASKLISLPGFISLFTRSDAVYVQYARLPLWIHNVVSTLNQRQWC